MEYLIYLVTFIVIYLLYLVFVILRKKKLEKFKTSTYVNYLTTVYKIDIEKINFKIMAHSVALSNSFIIATTLFVTSFVKNLYIKVLIGFPVLLGLIFLMYHLLGKLYQNKVK